MQVWGMLDARERIIVIMKRSVFRNIKAFYLIAVVRVATNEL